jgi:hypothetical protein
MFDIKFDYTDISSIISVLMITYVVYNIYSSMTAISNEQSSSSPLDFVYNLLGMNTTTTTVIDNDIRTEYESEAGEETDTLDDVLQNLPSQVNKNINCEINKSGDEDDIDDETNDDDEDDEDILDDSKLDDNNKLRMRKINLIKKGEVEEM